MFVAYYKHLCTRCSTVALSMEVPTRARVKFNIRTYVQLRYKLKFNCYITNDDTMEGKLILQLIDFITQFIYYVIFFCLETVLVFSFKNVIN